MIVLVRHAHAEYRPDESRGLSDTGRREALRVAEVLAGRPISAIVSSPYARAVETVAPLAELVGVPIAIDHDLRERRLSAGPLDDFVRWLEPTWRDFDLAYPGGESSAVAQARVSRAICRAAASAGGGQVVIASHGNALALFLHTLDPRVDFAFWAAMSMPDVYEVTTPGDAPWSFRRVWTGE